ncbi:DUF6233 domain-containing protein [Streptomyces sp. HMX112]|uniref:DUF6233 domain-containing protein n=1 Tax=Streptomyces sp. HMX112 TaxID=3390850 RepID=UPI003A80642F
MAATRQARAKRQTTDDAARRRRPGSRARLRRVPRRRAGGRRRAANGVPTAARPDPSDTEDEAPDAPHQRAAPPPVPGYRIQRSPGAGRAPTSVHVGTCGMGRPPGVSQDAARRALAEGVPACPVRRPDTELGVLDAGCRPAEDRQHGDGR